ncbi:hypothetical protein EIN_529000 [Entamoeba invadens IP1]|uniref:Uncharacterized protein n=1 Tax=Entamoeba invadens IP1 TaxID=370355 RepID=L7FKV3_ENTIV|nr:hypothetical protein EIN_529000 [Entamoeba invadens IP1]ELP85503.1 hypothetical protein EIN_529000 [Entamoeba invadens IP1]|eukprot:XP_004184849.1 hypothetical protein EIN_529000 [Entamoeba invadens IP1]
MFALLLVTLATAKYAVVSNLDGSTAVYKFDQCYYMMLNNYVKFEENGDKVKGYVSNKCGNWVEQASASSGDIEIKSDLPDYYFVQYFYNDADNCEFGESDAHPLENLYPQCTKITLVSTYSIKAEIKDKMITLTPYNSEDCTGDVYTAYTSVTYELEKCTSVNNMNYMFSEGAFEVFAFLALFIAFLF